jgi:hypothetical protein
MSENRMLVDKGESHTVEQDRLEKKIRDGIFVLQHHTHSLDAELFSRNWEAASIEARKIAAVAEYMTLLERRLEDVDDIIAQFARIQEQVDRIEKLIEEQEDVSNQ